MNNVFSAELHIPRHAISLASAKDFFKSLCTNLNIPDNISFHCEIAIEESLASLFEFEMDKNSRELLKIQFDFAEDEIRIVFQAPGRPFNFDRISKYDSERALSHNDVEGLGLFLLQSVMDVVQWKYVEKKGQELVIIKKLPSPISVKTAEGHQDLPGIPAPAVQEGAPREPIDYRVVNNYDDAFALTTCAYDLYHYDYKDVIYYPNELLSRNQRGLMRSWIAAEKNGTVLGHYALMKKYLSDTYAETGAAFVRPELRKAGVFKELAVRLHDDAAGLGLRGLYSLSVTNHIATQKLSEHYGRFTVGVRIASSPAVFVEGAKPGERTTTTLNYRQLVEREVRHVFVPPRYRDLICSSYRRLGITVAEEKGSTPWNGTQSSDRSFFDTTKDITWNRALISARGGDLICQKLQAFTDVLSENGIVCIMLSIDLEDPSALALAEAAVKTGYFYSGIFPEGFTGGSDALQMQRLNSLTVDPSSIQIYQESGKEIFEFITHEAPHIFSVRAD